MSQPENSSLDNDQVLRRQVRQYLNSLSDAGVVDLPVNTGQYGFEQQLASHVEEANSVEQATADQPEPAKAKPSAPANSLPKPKDTQSVGNASPSKTELFSEQPYGPTIVAEERPAQLNVLRTEVEACTKCPELCAGRTQTVFGVGNPSPRLVFVGEGPGAEEDRIGEPFVGAAGQLLDNIIKAMKMSREEVFILNTVKCRPPGNRNPSDQELANCWGFAERQLDILQPEFICCLGSVAARTVLQTSQSIGRMRGNIYRYRDSRVVVTYHPAYLLRTPSAKKLVWEDMQKLMTMMEADV